jgi:hypothetical protein
MPRLLWISGSLIVALASCHKEQPRAPLNDTMAVDENVAAGALPPDADIETLPPDESSVTSNGELAAGDDDPDVNDLDNGH